MNTSSIDSMLRTILEDLRVQTAEKGTLVAWADGADEQARAFARSRAFAIARESVPAASHKVLESLEEVVKVLSRSANPPARIEKGTAYFSPGMACIQEVLRQFNLARKSCDVCVFTITDDRITEAILRAAARGVEVRVITDNDKAHDLGSDIDRLRSSGIPCKMDVDNAAHMHHKFALFDGDRLMTGSFNWTRSASEQNEENLIVTPDPALVSAFGERFEKLWEMMS